MVRLATLLLTGLLLSACSSHQSTAVPPNAPIHDRSESAAALADRTVALVVRTELDEPKAFCSGVWVSAGMILTANHCVADDVIGDRVEYVVRDDIYAPGDIREREQVISHGSMVLARDEDHDLALLIAPLASLETPHAVALLSSKALRPGMFVQSMGAPLGLWWSYSSGDIAAVREIDLKGNGSAKVVFAQTTAPISPGNSGCGLFDELGQLVGIAHGSFVRGQNLNLFIHYQYADALMRANGLK